MSIAARERADLPREVVHELTEAHPFGAWRNVARVPADGALDYLRATIALAAARDDARVIAAEDADGRPAGLGVVHRLPEDSELLGIEAAAVAALLVRAGHPAPRAVYEALARELVEAAARSGFAHVTARCDADDREAQRALAGAGFARIETLVTLTHERGRAAPPVFPAEEAQAARVRPATPDDVPALRALAAARFRRNRYHRDDALPRARADALMARWIESYARETDDHEVWVAEDERGELAGFLGHALNRELERRAGVLVSGRALLATRDARDGVGRLLARTHVARSRGDLHEADTQLDNDGMLRVAFGLGMELTRARFTFTRAL